MKNEIFTQAPATETSASPPPSKELTEIERMRDAQEERVAEQIAALRLAEQVRKDSFVG